ncbi:MAG: carbohydrate ABC transporter permease [Candidatus Muiribacteriota bacterium]
MKFLRKYWLEIIMIIPLFAYIIGFTIVPIFTNLKNSFIDQRYGRRHDIITTGIDDIKYDLEQAETEAEREEYKKELALAQKEYEELKESPYRGFTLNNYKKLFSDRNFRTGIFNTLAITLIGLLFQFIIAMSIALLLAKEFQGKGFFRTIVLTPLGIPTIVSATIMTYIFDSAGFLNLLLYRIGLISDPVNWGQGGFLSIFMIVFADTWKVLPLMVLLFIAGLESIPKSVHEACSIDGSKSWYKFFTVILPLMKPHITIALIIRAIDAFRIFELPLILAGTATTPVISTFTYAEYARQNYNLSAASGTILTVLIMIFVFIYLFVVEREKGGEV